MLHILTTGDFERVLTFFRIKLNLFENSNSKEIMLTFSFLLSKQGFLRNKSV